MALSDLLELSSNRVKIGLSEERVAAIIPAARQYVALWREYPDLFVDFMAERSVGATSFHGLFFYQRVFLRAAARYKYTYAVFPRAYSKSFLAVMLTMIRCILYPGAKLFVTSGGKEQASGILQEKVKEICQMIPAFSKEINWARGQSIESKDHCRYVFFNGSVLDNLAATERSRGKRRHGGVMEECIGIDGTILNEVILPIMNVSRLAADGTKDDTETLNKSQIYITTAGWKNTFSYNKLIQILVWQIVAPDRAMVMGGTWRIPVLMHFLDRTFVRDLKMDGTYNEASFEREYESKWSGSIEDAFFTSEQFDRNRILRQPEYEYSGRSLKNA